MWQNLWSNIIHNPKTTITGCLFGAVIFLSALGIIPKEYGQLATVLAGGGASGALITTAKDPSK